MRVLEVPLTDEPRQRSRGGSTLIESMNSDLRGSTVLGGVHPQGVWNDGSGDAVVPRTRRGESARVLPHLLAHGESILIAIKLDVIGDDRIGFGCIARYERGIEKDAVQSRQLVEEYSRPQAIAAVR